MRRALATAGKAAVLTAFVVKASSACVDLDSLGNGVPIIDAAPETATGETGTFPDPCNRAMPPGPPQVDDARDTKLPAFVVALQEPILDTDQVAGFDLDGLCTCHPGPGTKADGGASCANLEPQCDLGGGADNAVASLAKVQLAGQPITNRPTRLIENGQRTVLLQLIDYNGLANDQDVTVGVFLAEGIRAQGCDASVPVDASGTWTPGRCGNDVWTVSDETTVLGASAVSAIKGKAYVSNYELVAQWETAQPLLPFTEEGTIPFHRALLHAKLVPLNEQLTPRDPAIPPTVAEQRLYKFERGVLAGRVPTSDVLVTLGSFRSASEPLLCLSPVFDVIRGQICANQDMPTSPDKAVDTPCGALSIAIGFQAWPALAGGKVPSPPAPSECDASVFTCPPQ